MRPSQIFRATNERPGIYHVGHWGAIGSPPQKNIVHYALSPNRMRPLAGAANAAIFNTFRRTRNQILYWAVPMLIAYECMQWATERNHYLNSKEGRAEYGDEV